MGGGRARSLPAAAMAEPPAYLRAPFGSEPDRLDEIPHCRSFAALASTGARRWESCCSSAAMFETRRCLPTISSAAAARAAWERWKQNDATVGAWRVWSIPTAFPRRRGSLPRAFSKPRRPRVAVLGPTPISPSGWNGSSTASRSRLPGADLPHPFVLTPDEERGADRSASLDVPARKSPTAPGDRVPRRRLRRSSGHVP